MESLVFWKEEGVEGCIAWYISCFEIDGAINVEEGVEVRFGRE